jgi:hypothetical protein
MKIDDLELMLLHDGELDREREQRIRAARLHSPELGRRLDALSSLGELVREWAEVNAVDAARERRQLRARKRRRVALASCSVLGACLVAWASASGSIENEGASTSAAAVPPREAVAVVAVAAKGDGRAPVLVESVDFGRRAGAIFMLETESAPTTVVWLPDGPEAGRIGTL